jgi:hypothetical protein
LKANLKKKLGYESGSKVGAFDEKKGGGKSHATVPLFSSVLGWAAFSSVLSRFVYVYSSVLPYFGPLDLVLYPAAF